MTLPIITTPMTAEFFSNSPFNLLHIDIMHDADWNDPFQILEALDVPMDLSGLLLELYIRPKFNHATLLRLLTSAGGAGIVFDDPQQGMASFILDRSVVSTLPIGTWNQFLVLTEGSVQTEIWRGECRIHPGRYS